MARKSDGLTPRQRQSQQIMREKAAMKKRRALLHKLYIVGGSALCLSLIGGGAWVWKSGAIGRGVQAVSDGVYGLSARAGFSLQAMYLEGRNRTPMVEIEEALGIRKGDPILRLSLPEARERLEKIESVKAAAVERSLPGTLYVRIIEREPVALWQDHGKLALVDDNGVVMTGLDTEPYAHLPLIVGDDAPKHVKELMEIVGSAPELARRFVAAVHVGERRWNIRLSANHGEVDVQLPEGTPADAWKRLAELQLREQVLDRDVKMIDLRLQDRIFIKLAPDALPGAAGARDT